MNKTLTNILIGTTATAAIVVGGAAAVPEDTVPQDVMDKIEVAKEKSTKFDKEKETKYKNLVKNNEKIDDKVKEGTLTSEEKKELKAYKIYEKTKTGRFYYQVSDTKAKDKTLLDKIKNNLKVNAQTVNATTTPEFEVEIVATNVIDGGIEAYVRAWTLDDWIIGYEEQDVYATSTETITIPGQPATTTATGTIPATATTTEDIIVSNYVGTTMVPIVIAANSPLGFGRDGDVEVERIRVFNPPVLIPNENGDIIREEYNAEFDTTSTRYLTEDPANALQQVIGDTIAKIANGPENIEMGKVGQTTTVEYPNGGTGGTHADGFLTTGYNATMALAHADTSSDGDGNETNTTSLYARSLKNGSGYYLSRAAMAFDTSAVGGDTISSATLSLYGDSWAYVNTHSSTIEIVEFTPASYGNFAAGDMDAFSFTSFASIAQASLSQSAYNDFTLNASGIAAIDGSGSTAFGAIFGTDLNITEHGTGDNLMNFLPADTTGTTQDPKLTVEHAASTHVATLTIDNTKVAADLTDFPVYVDLSDLPAAFWDSVASGCGDIRVFKSDDTTELPREVVSCDTATDTGELHIKYSGTLSSSADTDIHIYTDGVSSDYAASATYGSQNVWTNYKAVWHAEQSSGNLTDSTANGFTLTNTTGKSYVTSHMGKGIDFGTTVRNTTEFTTTSQIVTYNANQTISLWFKQNTALSATYGDPGFFILSSRSNPGATIALIPYYNSGSPIIRAVRRASGDAFAQTSFGNDTTTYHKIDMTYNYSGSSLKGYLDGSAFSTTGVTSSGSFNSSLYPISLGGSYMSSNAVSIIDEIRVAQAELSADWISTEYNNQSSPSTFYTASAVGGGGARRIIRTIISQ